MADVNIHRARLSVTLAVILVMSTSTDKSHARRARPTPVSLRSVTILNSYSRNQVYFTRHGPIERKRRPVH